MGSIMNTNVLYFVTIVAGIMSFIAFGLERLALTDIFHGESDPRLEWMMVNAALLPVVLFHVLGLISATVGLKHCPKQTRDAG